MEGAALRKVDNYAITIFPIKRIFADACLVAVWIFQFILHVVIRGIANSLKKHFMGTFILLRKMNFIVGKGMKM